MTALEILNIFNRICEQFASIFKPKRDKYKSGEFNASISLEAVMKYYEMRKVERLNELLSNFYNEYSAQDDIEAAIEFIDEQFDRDGINRLSGEGDVVVTDNEMKDWILSDGESDSTSVLSEDARLFLKMAYHPRYH